MIQSINICCKILPLSQEGQQHCFITNYQYDNTRMSCPGQIFIRGAAGYRSWTSAVFTLHTRYNLLPQAQLSIFLYRWVQVAYSIPTVLTTTQLGKNRGKNAKKCLNDDLKAY